MIEKRQFPENCPTCGAQFTYEIILNLSITELNLPPRIVNALLRRNVKTIKQLIEMDYSTLRKTRNIGQNAINKILEEIGFLNPTFRLTEIILDQT